MKRTINFIFGLLMLVPAAAFAQKDAPDDIRADIENLRKNVYTRVLSLTDAEGAKFWPVMDQMQREMDAVHREMRKNRKKVADNYSSISDADMDKAIDDMMNLEQKQLDIKKKYIAEFKKVLPVKKVALIPKAEREFKHELLDKLRRDGDPDE